jgi:hypothetical protein
MLSGSGDLWISLSYATFGVSIVNGIVAEAPPIARWMTGRNVAEVVRWARGKRAVIKAKKAGGEWFDFSK